MTGAWNGLAVLPEGLHRVHMRAAAGLIELDVLGTASEAEASGQPIAVPGFIDLHVHGGLGHDFMDASGAALKVARAHAQRGTTALLATTLTSPPPELQRAFVDARDAMRAPHAGKHAQILGVHLEGPYINPGKLGAQPPHTRAADWAEIEALHALAPIRVITLAPEVEAHLAAIPRLARMGMRVQIGHSTASYEDAQAALNAGAAGATHLFNAMSAFGHRAPGVAGAVLAHGHSAEMIVDLQHVHPGAIRVAMRCLGGLYCVTDATAAAGMPDGEFQLGGQRVQACMGAVRLADGTLAGSSLTMDAAFRNLVGQLRLSLPQAVAMTATRAADYLGEAQRGRLASGCVADWVVLDPQLKVEEVVIAGEVLQ